GPRPRARDGLRRPARRADAAADRERSGVPSRALSACARGAVDRDRRGPPAPDVRRARRSRARRSGALRRAEAPLRRLPRRRHRTAAAAPPVLDGPASGAEPRFPARPRLPHRLKGDLSMARPESQAIAGYFPTPEHLVPAIASLVALERERYGGPILFDPCAGTGAALVTLAGAVLDLAPADAARYCLGIELEATRAETLAGRLPHGGARSGDAFTYGLGAGPGASVLFLNPPYDTDRE